MKTKLIIILIIISIFSLSALAQLTLFISTEKGELKSNPNGQTIVKLNQGTEVKALRTQDDWVKVSLEGWVHKDSITMNKEEIEAPEEEVAGDFNYQNLELKSLHGTAELSGEIKNQSGPDYNRATFIVNVYNSSGSRIGNSYVNLRNFKTGENKEFRVRIGVNYSQVDSYEIKFQEGL